MMEVVLAERERRSRSASAELLPMREAHVYWMKDYVLERQY
jgi:hypothetical protein